MGCFWDLAVPPKLHGAFLTSGAVGFAVSCATANPRRCSLVEKAFLPGKRQLCGVKASRNAENSTKCCKFCCGGDEGMLSDTTKKIKKRREAAGRPLHQATTALETQPPAGSSPRLSQGVSGMRAAAPHHPGAFCSPLAMLRLPWALLLHSTASTCT